ncbi:hypothetical protein AB5J55_43640 [Streptomyces sp. R11]|uniref:Uncharacterized protein n=1 Tax=Streptomyces sp. R11 TaxID=3238625 RepID=A0AB39NDJ0_9ACTN
MNPERFEERLMHELKNHVQRAQQEGAEETAAPRPARSRRVRWVPVTVGAGLTAAAAITALILGQAPNAGGGQAVSSGTGQSLGRITNVAYTLEQQNTGKVKLTIEDPSGKPDVEAMRRDLAHMGVRAKVLLGDPECLSSPPPAGAGDGSPETPAPQSSAPTPSASVPAENSDGLGPFHITRENGKLDPAIVPTGNTLIIGFPAAHTEHPLGVMMIADSPGDGPNCIAAAPADAIQPALQQ